MLVRFSLIIIFIFTNMIFSIKSMAKIYFSPTVKVGSVSISSENESFKKRNLYLITGEGILGYKIRDTYLLGGRYEYSSFSQPNDPDKLEGSNLEGSSTNLGAVGGFVFNSIELLVHYDFKSSYKLKKKSSEGKNVTFEKPRIYGVSFRIKAFTYSWLGLEYFSASYKETQVAGLSDTSQGKVGYNGIGLSLGLVF